MTVVTLTPLGDGSYAVTRAGHDTGARVVNGVRRWVVHHRGIGVSGDGWTRAPEVVAWLESDAGRDWLDQLETR